ncbi:MAG: L,D-transpeptidase/peptidoglycan binding protein, partial [Lachnospiraceae bacterium]|nr:L,D-transpeptidase/peptidoglycan binding protein [Lachnospiraceae bacterium]
SGMTLEELETQTENYMLRIVERKPDGSVLEEDIQGKDIGLTYVSMEPLEDLMQNQNRWLWFMNQDRIYETEQNLTYQENLLEQEVKKLMGFSEAYTAAPTDAYISEYDPETGFTIMKETQGSQLNWKRTMDAVRTSVENQDEIVDLDAMGCYETPKVLSDDPGLLQTLDKLKKYGDIKITYTFGENVEILDGKMISSWLVVDGYEVILDQNQVENYVATLRKRYDSIFRSRTFHTSYGKEVTIKSGDYGWWMNYGQEAKELAAMIENGESGERTPVYYQTAAAYGNPDYGTTYVEINLTAQHLFFYKEGELILESDFVSGNAAKGYDTPDGVYGITYKQRNATLVGETYRTPVSYWMPFNRNIGMHDATWRSSFGGKIYKTNGSHGCINLPYSVAQELYSYVEKGMPVICYYLPGTESVSVNETVEK